MSTEAPDWKTIIPQRLTIVHDRINAACTRSHRRTDSVQLVCITKNRPLESVLLLHECGENHCGENRVQDAKERIAALPKGITWHLTGQLQTNKAKYLPGLISWVHSLDRIDIAEALNKAWEKHPYIPKLNVLIQVNIAGEEQKAGVEPDGAAALLEAVVKFPRLSVQGFMTMAPYSDDPETSRPVFRGLRELRDGIQEKYGILLPHLSMGMTGDFEVAVEEGATLLRVGTALFEA